PGSPVTADRPGERDTGRPGVAEQAFNLGRTGLWSGLGRPLLAAQHAEKPPDLVERLSGLGRDRLELGADLRGKPTEPVLRRLRLDDDHRHPVCGDIVQVARDPGALLSQDGAGLLGLCPGLLLLGTPGLRLGDRKSTRLNSSHVKLSYAVFCLK